MKHLIIYSHINPNSFSHAILETLIDVSEKSNVEYKIRDLNAADFNPILSAADMAAFNKGETPADIKAEQNLLEWADVISFIYPLWWGHMPAILKGYIDRVFAYNFAYTYTSDGKDKGLLPDKKIMMFTPMGNPYAMYDKMGMIGALNMTTDTCIFRFCGITDVEHLHFGSVVTVSSDTRKKMLNDVEELANSKLSA